MRVTVNGKLPEGVTAKDIALAVIAKIGTAGGTGYVIEYAGEAVRALSMEGRMTLCNLTIEGGARAGLIAVDETTIDYIKGRPRAPKAAAFEAAAHYWRTLQVRSRRQIRCRNHAGCARHRADGDLGHLAGTGAADHRQCARSRAMMEEHKRAAAERALDYMGLTAGMKLTDIKVDHVFIGSCTNGRIEDLRAAAAIAQAARRCRAGVNAIVVPGSGLVKEQAEEEGLDKMFLDAGFEWRDPGCSMCLAMNADKLKRRRTLRLDLQPQFRRPPGPRRAHASGVARDGCGCGDYRPSHGRAHASEAECHTCAERLLALVITVFCGITPAFAHDVDLTKLPLGDGKISAAPQVGADLGLPGRSQWRRRACREGPGSTRPTALSISPKKRWSAAMWCGRPISR